MPSFTMQELMRSMGLNPDVALTSPLTSHSPTGGKEVKRMGQVRGRSIPETKELIKKAISEAGRPLSVAEICVVLERKQTPHIRNLLHQMGDSGELIENADLAPSKMLTRFWYSLP
jgi:predicted MarR family transcription regulator